MFQKRSKITVELLLWTLSNATDTSDWVSSPTIAGIVLPLEDTVVAAESSWQVELKLEHASLASLDVDLALAIGVGQLSLVKTGLSGIALTTIHIAHAEYKVTIVIGRHLESDQ